LKHLSNKRKKKSNEIYKVAVSEIYLSPPLSKNKILFLKPKKVKSPVRNKLIKERIE